MNNAIPTMRTVRWREFSCDGSKVGMDNAIPAMRTGSSVRWPREAEASVSTTDRADAGQALGRAPERGHRVRLRTQVGRGSRGGLEERRRRLYPEPRPEAARPLLSGARGPAAGQPPRSLRA